MRFTTRSLVLALLALFVPRAPEAQAFTAGAASQLNILWTASSDAKLEIVACLAGHDDGREITVTRIDPVPDTTMTRALDGVSAEQAIEHCAPPEYVGTVHSHIARFQGQPYRTLSPNDRYANTLWEKRHHAEGLFCVLWSDEYAHCERGTRSALDPRYAYGRGNALVFASR